MNNLRKATLTTLEVAEMMEVPHKDILKKLEGSKDRKGYIEIMTERQMSPSDFFIPSSYKDASGKENKCYEVTRLGCDFLANKSIGEKGVLFTARYVKRFHEMEAQITQTPLTEHPGEVANYLKEMGKRMEQERMAPHKIAEAFKMVSQQYGIQLPDDFVKVPEYEQMELSFSEKIKLNLITGRR